MEERRKELTTRKCMLYPGTELRFKVECKKTLSLRLTTGLAEIFGTQLVRGKEYTFSGGSSTAVTTFHGCSLEVTGSEESAYIAERTPMVLYFNIHAALEQMREMAEIESEKGPIVLVVGPPSVGKSTLCRILLNYAVYSGRKPMFVDLDVDQNEISLPGTIGAVLVERSADVEEGFSMEAPLVYHYGHKCPGTNVELYETLISRLAEGINSRTMKSNKIKFSGTIINTCGWVKGEGDKIIYHAARALEVNAILVINEEKLWSELFWNMPSSVTVVDVPMSGGVIKRDKIIRSQMTELRIRKYFYGLKNSVYPYSLKIKFSAVKIFKIGAPLLPDSCLPLGTTRQHTHTKLVSVRCSNDLLHRVLSVCFKGCTEQDTLSSNKAGFVCVTDIDEEREFLTVLCPRPKLFSNNFFLYSDFRFLDC